MSDKILSGVKVVEMSTYLAGPICARILGDWGADVVKVEGMRGDPVRSLGMNLLSPVDDDENPVFFFANANKRIISLNQRVDEGREVMRKLVNEADVFITNNREDALKAMGLDFETLKEKNPRLIFAHVLGYGEKGPHANRPAFDFTTYFARSGFMNVMPDAETVPTYNVPGFGDLQLSMFLAGGVAAALYNREKTGKGDYVNTSLYHIGIYDLGIIMAGEPYASIYPISRRVPLSPIVCTYKCSDGEWYYLGCSDYNIYFPKICRVLGLDKWADDEEYASIMGMLSNAEEIRTTFDEKFIHKTSFEWETIFSDADIPGERVYKLQDVLKDEQAWANDFLVDVKFGSGNSSPLVTTPVRFRSAGTFDYRLPGGVGCNTDEILGEIGFSKEDIEKMKENKIVNG